MRRSVLMLLVGSTLALAAGCVGDARSAAANVADSSGSRLIRHLETGQRQHVVIFGTSLSQSGAWVPQLRDALQARFPGLVTLTNTAEGGQSSEWGRAHVDSHVIAYRPDVVFIEFAINDAVARFNLSPDRVRENLDFILDRITAALPDCEIILQVMNPVVGKPAGDFSHRRNLPAYEQIYRDAAKRRGLLLIDHSRAWAELLRIEGEAGFRRYVPDGVHPNADGYARFVTPRILEALLRTQPARSP